MMIGAGQMTATARADSFKEPDFESKGLGPAYRSLITFGQADDLVYEFATYTASPGRRSMSVIAMLRTTNDDSVSAWPTMLAEYNGAYREAELQSSVPSIIRL